MTPRFFRIALALAVVVALAAIGGVLLAQRPTATATAATNAAAPSASPSPHRVPILGPSGFGCAPGGGAIACRASGTVTAISGTTLTLRTFTGTLTVNTDGSTTYQKEGKSVSFDAIHVNDVVNVRPIRPSGSSTPPASPPTTVTARAIVIDVPTFVGRVTSIDGPTLFIVTPNGQLAYIYTTGGTTYMKAGAAAKFSDITVGSYVVGEGTQSDLTHLTADDVHVMTAPAGGAAPRPFQRPFGPPGTTT